MNAASTSSISVDRPAVEVVGLSYTFVGRDRPSISDISFTLPPASWTAIAGRTGSGKSTLLRALAGLIPHHAAGRMQGVVRLLGEDTRALGPADLARRVGLILQSPDDQFCATTVEAEIAFGLENLGLSTREIGSRIDKALTSSGLADLRQRPLRHLSGGQKQRLLLASVMALEPRVLLLDEPLAQLDPFAAAELLAELDRLRRDGMTIALAEHRLDEILPLADHVLVIDDGQLVDDVPADGAGLCEALARHGLAPPEVSQLALALDCGPLRTADEICVRLEGPLAIQDTANAERVELGERPSASEPRPIVRVENLAYRFPGSQHWAWRGLSFDLDLGDCVAVVGANGSGKSTLLNLLAGLARPTEGRIERVAGSAIATDVGLVPQNPDLTLFSSTVRDELAFGPRQRGLGVAAVDSLVARLARELDLESLLDEPPLALSQGQRLRTAVAAAMSIEPGMLLLDEPTTGQDREQVKRVMAAVTDVQRRSTSAGCVLFSTHDLLTVARYAGRVLVLADGRLVADCTPEDLLADDALLAVAHLRRPPLLEVRHRLGLCGVTADEIVAAISGRTGRRGVDRLQADRGGVDR